MADKSVISVEGIGVSPSESSAVFVPMRDPVIYPYGLASIVMDSEERLAILKYALAGDRMLVFFPEIPSDDELSSVTVKVSFKVFNHAGKRRSLVGVLARVVKELKFPDGSSRIIVRGLKRVRFNRMLSTDGGVEVAVFQPLPEDRVANKSEEVQARRNTLLNIFRELVSIVPGTPEELQVAVLNAPTPDRLTSVIADSMNFSYLEKVLVLAVDNLVQRLSFMIVMLNHELEVARLGAKLQREVTQVIGRQQRELYLREQLSAIQRELGEESRSPDIVELRKRIGATVLPERVQPVIQKELSRLEMIPQASPEYSICYDYITWLLEVPWQVFTEDQLDCSVAMEVLEADHYGLKDVKERIIEFLAVLQLRKAPSQRAPILCLVGPAGVGKTSLGRSIARAMNRKFVRVSLGGVRDEAEIRGHRRTYIGAMPGRIVQNLKKAGTANPVFMLDEIDKLANDFRGDPAAALLEVLDPAQNSTFNDHYIEVDCDLSRVFFIATANLLDTIPVPLRDRMEIIRLPGYTSFEKREISRRYLVPRQLDENGLSSKQVRFLMGGIDELIDHYTREAGVRELERVIGQVLRKLARRIVEGGIEAGERISIDSKLVQELLGPRKFLLDEAEVAGPGYAIGMAWTSCGGVIMPIEVTSIPGGKGMLKLTGSLGKVMQESAETAFSLIRAHASEWKLKPAYFFEHDFHIHVPDGATPKDGPSAGITLTTALISLLIGKRVMPKLAMTGEITLRGKVSAVGGIREKVIAALRAGIKHIVMPKENEKDTLEIPEEVRNKLVFHFVEDFHEVLEIAFPPKKR